MYKKKKKKKKINTIILNMKLFFVHFLYFDSEYINTIKYIKSTKYDDLLL